MKIGILTLPLNTNYGGILQAYALQNVLEQMGNEVVIIDNPWWLPHLTKKRAPISYTTRLFQKYILHKNVKIFQEKYDCQTWDIILQNLIDFVNSHLHRKTVSLYRDIRNHWDLDAMVVGSDQIWRRIYFPDKIDNAFLDFLKDKDIIRVSYAASFGMDKLDYTDEEIANCGQLLRLFNGIGVREKSAIDLCKKHFGIDAQLVIDPTMLLTRKDYEQLISEKSLMKHNGALMVSILDLTENRQQQVAKVVEATKLKAFYPLSKSFENSSLPVEERIIPPIESWLQGFRDAEFIVTDSFHACVFSILFHKPFMALGNKVRGMSRFTSLLSLFGLEKHLVEDVKNFDFTLKIDWQDVDKRLNDLRKEGMSFLAMFFQECSKCQ